MTKRKIWTYLVVIAILIVSINIIVGIININYYSKAFGVLIDNQTGEDIRDIGLKIQENEQIMTVKEMLPGNYEEFAFRMNNQQSVSEEEATITVNSNIKATISIPIKEGKRTLIRLIGNEASGIKAEYIGLV